MEWIVLAVVVVVALLMVMLYNRLVALRQTRNNAFSDIDVQLKQRYDLVPQLVETVKGYAAHEKQVFENVTNARAQVGAARGGNPESRMKAEGMFGGAIAGLLAVAENYPQLKADQNFQRLMDELSDIENKIAAARRFFNNAVQEYNTGIQQMPAALFAGMFGFTHKDFFDLGASRTEVEAVPNVKF